MLKYRCKIVWFLLAIVSICRVESLVDPHDMFEIFNSDDVVKSSSEPSKEKTKTNDSVLKSSKTSDSSKPCIDFVYTLLDDINRQLKHEIREGDYDVTVRLSLTWSEIQTLRRHRGDSDELRSQTCSILKESVEREPLISWFSTVSYIISDACTWIWDCLGSAVYYLRFFRFRYKDMVTIMWLAVFLSTLTTLVMSRSIAMSALWLLLCVLFFSTYTTYQHKYQTAIAAQDAQYLPFVGKGMPRECLQPTKGTLQRMKEFFTGPQMVQMSDECKEFLIQQNISPEIQIKLSDCLSETISSFFTMFINVLIGTAHQVADRSSAKFSFFTSWTVYIIIFLTTAFVGMFVMCLSMRYEFALFGFSVRPTSNSNSQYRGHRQIIQTVETPHTGCCAPQVDFVEHQQHPSSCLCGVTQEFPRRLRENETRQLMRFNIGDNVIKRKPKPIYRKLKSVAFIESSTPKSVEFVRRKSF